MPVFRFVDLAAGKSGGEDLRCGRGAAVGAIAERSRTAYITATMIPNRMAAEKTTMPMPIPA